VQLYKISAHNKNILKTADLLLIEQYRAFSFLVNSLLRESQWI